MAADVSRNPARRFSVFEHVSILSTYWFTVGILMFAIIWPYLNTPSGQPVLGLSSERVIGSGILGPILLMTPFMWDGFRNYKRPVSAAMVITILFSAGIALCAQLNVWSSAHSWPFKPDTFADFYVGVN